MKILDVKNNEKTVAFEIQLDEKQWKIDFANAKRNIAKNVQIAGFRKGHVPASKIDEMYPADQIAYDTLNRTQQKTIDELVKTDEFNKADCLDSITSLEVVKLSGDKAPVIRVVFDAIPKVSGFEAKDVKEIEIPKFVGREIPAEFIKQQAKQWIKNDAMISVKKDGIVTDGSIAVIDFKGYKDGVAFPGGEGKDFELEIGSKTFIDNFEEQLIALKKGESKEVFVTFPKDYQAKDLAGAKVKFDVTVKEVKEIEYPEIDKAYLNKLHITKGEGMKAIEDHIKSLFAQEDELHYSDDAMKIIQEAIVKKVKLNYYPASLLRMHKDQVLKTYEDEAKKHGYKSLADYKKALSLDDSAFDLILTNSAKTCLDVAMCLEKLIEEYNLDIEAKDREDYLEKLTRYFGNEAQAKKAMEVNKDYVEQMILKDKLTKKLIAEAKKVEPKKEEPKAEEKKPAAKKTTKKATAKKTTAKKSSLKVIEERRTMPAKKAAKKTTKKAADKKEEK